MDTLAPGVIVGALFVVTLLADALLFWALWSEKH